MKGVRYECPKCGYIPTSILFDKILLTNYQMNIGKLKRGGKLGLVRCQGVMCDYSGNLIEWTKIIYKNGE